MALHRNVAIQTGLCAFTLGLLWLTAADGLECVVDRAAARLGVPGAAVLGLAGIGFAITSLELLRRFLRAQVGEVFAMSAGKAEARDAVAAAAFVAIVDVALVGVALVALWFWELRVAALATTIAPLVALRVTRERSVAIGTGVLLGFALGMLLWFGITEVTHGTLPIGRAIGCLALEAILLARLVELVHVRVAIERALAALEPPAEVVTVDAPVPLPEKPRFEGLRDAVELCDIGFESDDGARLLGKLSMRIPAGQTIAIIGDRSTSKWISRLLMRFQEPLGGELLFDGVDARELEPASLRARLATVEHPPFLVRGTLREHVALGRAVSPEEVVRATLLAGLGALIIELPDGLDTDLADVALTPIQRQRVAIARALVGRPDVIVFDEATCELDLEAELRDGLQAALAGRTLVILAQKRTTARRADLIYVVDAGQVVESGSHGQLVAARGVYSALVEVQTEATASRALESLLALTSREPGRYAETLARHVAEPRRWPRSSAGPDAMLPPHDEPIAPVTMTPSLLQSLAAAPVDDEAVTALRVKSN